MKPRTRVYLLFWGTCLHRSRTAGCRHVVKSALAIAILITSGIASAPSAQAQTETVLHSFTGSPDGEGPVAVLIFDSAGNLYGTTNGGGASGYGTVFKLDPTGKETVLYSFAGAPDAANPQAGLVFDSAGNLYGTTAFGGTSGNGTVFKLDPTGKETVLYSFAGSPDGANPYAGLVFDSEGNLYGTTVNGGTSGNGTVFKLDPTGEETVLYSFGGSEGGANPYAGLVLDSAGSILYGTTYAGGVLATCHDYIKSDCIHGIVFSVTTTGGEGLVYRFAGPPEDGARPLAGLVFDPEGNLFGTTVNGGVDYPDGTVFRLNPIGKEETVLHSFAGCPDGRYPQADLVFDSAGNLYGTTSEGGVCSNYGTVFKLDTTGKETVLHSFTGSPDGKNPLAGLVLDSAGNLYGTTNGGGASGKGTVFKLTAVTVPNFGLSASPSNVTLAQGGAAGTSTVTITPSNDFSGSVTLSASGLPSGVTASFSPNPATDTSTLSLTASSTASVGTVSVTITGTSGSLVNSATVNLTVTATPNFNVMSAASVPSSISPGSSATSTITVMGTDGFAGSVTLSCSVAPSKSGDTDLPTCSVTGTNPVALSSTTTSATSTVTVNTTGSSLSVRFTPNHSASSSWLALAAAIMLAALFYAAPARRRWSTLAAAMLFAALVGLGACGSSNSGSGGGGGSGGTSADTYTITVSGASGGTTQSSTFEVTVN